jgi:hypothetical protein
MEQEVSRAMKRIAGLLPPGVPTLGVCLLGVCLLVLLGSPQAFGSTIAEQYLLAAANQERAALGLQPLHWDAHLAQAATEHAQVMARHGSISHQFPGEAELSARGAAAGVHFSVIAENVAEAPSAVTIHDMWMHSPGHRANLLDASVNAVGISVLTRGGQLFAVQDFAKTVQNVSLADQEASILSLVSQNGIRSLDTGAESTVAARKTCAMSTGWVGARQPWFVMRFTSDSLTQLPGELKTHIASGKYHQAAVGACTPTGDGPFGSYNLAVLLYP